MQAVATYRIAPKEELAKRRTAKGWFEKANVEGVVAMRPVKQGQAHDVLPRQWVNPYYSTLWGYYGYGWGSMYSQDGRAGHDRRRRDDDLQRAPQRVDMGRGQRNQEPKDASASFIDDLVKECCQGAPQAGPRPTTPEVGRPTSSIPRRVGLEHPRRDLP